MGIYLFAVIAFAASLPKKVTTYGDAVVAEVTSIYDGDTFGCNIKPNLQYVIAVFGILHE